MVRLHRDAAGASRGEELPRIVPAHAVDRTADLDIPQRRGGAQIPDRDLALAFARAREPRPVL